MIIMESKNVLSYLLLLGVGANQKTKLENSLISKIERMTFCNLFPLSNVCADDFTVDKPFDSSQLSRPKRHVWYDGRSPACRAQPCQKTTNVFTINVSCVI